MKYTAALAVGLAALASAQDITVFPECSVPCIMDAISSATPCDTDDFACVCENRNSLAAAATGCVVDACGADVALSTPSLFSKHTTAPTPNPSLNLERYRIE